MAKWKEIPSLKAMADRIEELEAENKLLSEGAALAHFQGVVYARENMADRIEELEAKLAKAVEALERIASGEFSGRMLTSMPPQDAAAYFARTTLAELKGDDPE